MTGPTPMSYEAPGVVAVGVVLARALRRGRLWPLMVPAVAVLMPAILVSGVVFVAVLGEDGHVVNGEQVVWSRSPSLTGVLAVGGAVILVAYAVAVGAASVMAGAELLGRPVTARTALRSAAGRVRTLVALTVGGVVVGAATADLAAAVWRAAGATAGVMAIALVPAVLGWSVLALPAALLEGHGAEAAVARAFSLTRHRRVHASMAVAFFVVGFPSLVVFLAWSPISRLNGVAHAVAGGVAAGAGIVVITAFQGLAVAVIASNTWYPPVAHVVERPRPLDLAQVARRLPRPDRAVRARGRMTAAVLAPLVVLPGLLYAGYLRADPLNLVTTGDHTVDRWVNATPVTLHLPGTGRPVALSGPYGDGFTTFTCTDQICDGVRRSFIEAKVTEPPELASVTMPDGAVIVVAWTPDLARRREFGMYDRALRLVRCVPAGCGDLRTAPILRRGGIGAFDFAVAATRMGGGLLIASLGRTSDDDDAGSSLRLLRCDDPGCSRRRSLASIPWPRTSNGLESRPMAVAAGPAGRPVVAVEDRLTGSVTLVACDAAACRRPVVRNVARPALAEPLETDSYLDGVDVEVPADDRPLIVHRDAHDGGARLVTCRTPSCDRTTTTALTGPGFRRPWPAIALGRNGRPVIATYDLTRRRLILIMCRDTGCTARTTVPVAEIRDGPGRLDLAVAADGRPYVLWNDGDSALRLTVCESSHCRT